MENLMSGHVRDLAGDISVLTKKVQQLSYLPSE